MPKRIVSIVLILTLLFTLTACGKEEKDTETLDEGSKQKEITVILPYSQNADWIRAFEIGTAFVKRKFEEKYNVRVNIKKIEANTYDEYIKKRNTLLYKKEGPVLIGISWGNEVDSLIDEGIILKVKNKIPNYKKVYEKLRHDYYVPVGITVRTMPIRKDILEKLGIPEPSLDWTKEDFYKIRDKWLEKETVYLTNVEMGYEIKRVIDNLYTIDKKSKKVKFDKEKIKEAVKELKERIFSDRYIIDKKYRYENFLNMYYVKNSKERKKSWELHRKNSEKHFIDEEYTAYINALKTLDVQKRYANKDNILFLSDLIFNRGVSLWGFVVNKNGRNVEEGLKFINEFLSDEVQLILYKNPIRFYPYAPVNMEIEDEIEKLEIENDVKEDIIKLRKYILNKIKKGEFYYNFNIDSINRLASNLVDEILFISVFSDKNYSDKEIEHLIDNVEDRLNIYLSE